MIAIKVNQETHQFSEILSVAAFVRLITINMNNIAVVLNGNIAKKLIGLLDAFKIEMKYQLLNIHKGVK
jgi:hypothetical protein